MSSNALMQEDATLNFGEEDDLVDRKKKLKHPIAVFCHILFRASAIVAFLICTWFSSSFITNFVVIIILLCMDFWTVKNITGRLLVGLRWWNYVDENGESRWVYESRKGSGTIKISAAESRIFWMSLVVCQVIWAVFLFFVFFLGFKWLIVAIVGFLMNGANLYGYVRCKVGTKESMKSVASSFFSTQMFRSMMSSAASSATAPTPKPQESRTQSDPDQH